MGKEMPHVCCLTVSSLYRKSYGVLDIPVLGRWEGGTMSLERVLHWAQTARFKALYSKYSSQLKLYILSVIVYARDLQLHSQNRKLHFHVARKVSFLSENLEICYHIQSESLSLQDLQCLETFLIFNSHRKQIQIKLSQK